MRRNPKTVVSFEDELAGALNAVRLPQTPTPRRNEFFNEWFWRRGHVYFFLFKKNLKVTNIQVAELVALARMHLRCKGEPIRDVQFLSREDFNDSVQRLIQGFPDTAERVLVQRYGSLLSRALVLEPLLGSCIVYIPLGLDLDLQPICANSGYIHSCGYCVYARNVYKAEFPEFLGELNAHLERYEVGIQQPAMFRAYSHEDFTASDRHIKAELRFGLDDVKVFMEKFYMGSQTLPQAIATLRRELPSKLFVREGDYKIDLDVRTREGLDPTRTLWLIIDHPFGQAPRQADERQFLICYDQLFNNENPFHLLDEDKPAWVDHTTIPHTLMGAMINLTRPYWPDTTKVAICDPFLGSGTAYLECIKFPEVVFEGFDVDEIVPLLVDDNLAFFGSSHPELCEYDLELQELVKGRGTSSLRAARAWATKFYEGVPKDSFGTVVLNREQVATLRQKKSLHRLIFYLILKTKRRKPAATDSGPFDEAFCQQAGEFCVQLSRMRKIRDRQQQGASTGTPTITCPGEYSNSCSLDFEYVRTFGKSAPPKYVVRVQKIEDLKAERTYDVIVTDPPYGFNTAEGPEPLAELYSLAIEAMIKALKDGGQLVFALPDWSLTGRHLPSFTHKSFVTHQVLITAEKLDREVFSSAIQVPRANLLFTAPYYWESERALRRAILHFRFRDRPKYKRNVPANANDTSSAPEAGTGESNSAMPEVIQPEVSNGHKSDTVES